MSSSPTLQPQTPTLQTATPSTNWNIGTTSALVNIGTHSLALHASGPDRNPGDPATLFIAGAGSSITSFAAAHHLLKPFIRVFTYDRSGYGSSDLSPNAPTAENIARELDELLTCAGVEGPWIIVAHSWGGILACEFLEVGNRRNEVVGIVFEDANSEGMMDVLDWRTFFANPVVAGLDYPKITKIQQRSKLTPEEWEVYQQTINTPKHKAQAAAEFAVYGDSFPSLKSKKQRQNGKKILGKKPVYVLKGDTYSEFQTVFEKGVEMGRGGEGDKEWCREFLRTASEKDRVCQKTLLGLSEVGWFEEVMGAGHHVHSTRPERVVQGVRWVLERIEGVEKCGK